MEFASSYVLDEASEEDYFDDDKLNDNSSSSSGTGDASLSDEEVEVKEDKAPKKLRKVRKADTNICSVNLGTLAEDAEVFTGEITFCNECRAIFTSLSKLHESVWTCEFCGFCNKVDLEEEEIPHSLSVDYLMSPAVETGTGDLDDIVVFCVDISGSMCCTTEVQEGEFKIRQDKALEESLRQFLELAPGGGFADQFFPGQSRGVTYVSRLQCVQAAVSDQVEKLAKENPNKRVAIVSFSNDVTIHLPGGVTHVITGEHLHDYEYLLSCSDRLSINLNSSVKEKEQEIISTILGLTEGGATVLGPALLTAISLAGKKKGSSVVLCTDGIANIGLGSLENLTNENINSHPAPAFYRKATQTALDLGVAVSIISIQGENARLEYIAKVAADTRGFNDIVDPLNLTKGFNFILENKIIATDVTVTLMLHKGLKVRHEKVVEDAATTKVVKTVGNCNANSVLTFEYGRKKGIDLSNLKTIPFQIQISYTKPSGTKCMRVVAKETLITRKREEAEAHVNVAVGDYTKARMKQKSNMRMVRRGLMSNQDSKEEKAAHYSIWNSEAVKFNKLIKAKKKKEKKEGRNYHSAEDDGSFSEEEYDSGSDESDAFFKGEIKNEVKKEEQPEKKEKGKRKMERKLQRGEDDAMSNVMYQAQNPLYSAYHKK